MKAHCDPVRAAEDLARRVLARKRVEGTATPAQTSTHAQGSIAVLRLVEGRGTAGTQPATPAESATTPLPKWADTVRGVPNAVLRSALFGVLKKGPRRHLECQRIAAVQGTEVFYSGEQLDQGDLDVWTMLLHLLREHTLGSSTRLTAYQMLRWLGKKDTGGRGGNRGTLDTRLSRLHANKLNIRVGSYHYQGRLVEHLRRDDVSGEYAIGLNPALHELFAKDQYTEVDAAIRSALEGQPLAHWLHGFYSSHAAPLPVSVKALHHLCGSGAKRLDHFRQDLRKALITVTDICTANGQPFSAEIIEDLVHVRRTPSRSQRKHLAKRRTTTHQDRGRVPP
ncbi:MAG TPA: plasmid replication initiator TrfA [Lamprocystis sp. (in: g-proteobacteria)]|nr:plasmid replication initiator TrfA [Lamprocystis sp. (in: g-proteobacteria)]